jgi:hypothetical protein
VLGIPDQRLVPPGDPLCLAPVARIGMLIRGDPLGEGSARRIVSMSRGLWAGTYARSSAFSAASAFPPSASRSACATSSRASSAMLRFYQT